MREVLESLEDGQLTPEEAEVALAGYLTDEAGRFDAAREARRGVPEAILAEGKTPEETADLAEIAVETAGRAIVTRASETHLPTVAQRLRDEEPNAAVRTDARARMLVAHGMDFEPPILDATIGVVAAGTADAQAAAEAAIMAEEIGATVERVDDVGVANLTRITDQLSRIRDFDVTVVAAGREGALPTVVAGLVETPVIGLPVSSGYGYGGEGTAALAGMLQSCTVLSVVNIDAGFVAGAQAGLIARTIDRARSG